MRIVPLLLIFFSASLTLAADLTPATPLAPHPRLLLPDLPTLRTRIHSDPLLQKLYDSERAAADALLKQPLLTYKKTGIRLLFVSRDALGRISRLSLLHRLDPNPAYLARAKSELLAVCAFPDWNPSHFLDTAEMSTAVAIGYDWLYDELDEPTRATLRTALIEKGLKPSFPEFSEKPASLTWITRDSNWNQVCHGGLTFAALAAWESAPELAAKTVNRALAEVPRHGMKVYAPDGAYPEGPGYWEYGTLYNVLFIEALRTSLGSDFSLSSAPGFGETAVFQNEVLGPTMQWFNFADCGPGGSAPSPILSWFVRDYHRPDFALSEHQRLESALAHGPLPSGLTGFLELLFFDPAPVTQIDLALSWTGRSDNPVAVHRSSFTDPTATFLAIKAGRPNVSHGQQDVGTFVFDADGVRWAIDLGAEDYNRIESRGMNLWANTQNTDRWKIFRLQAAAHNVITFPDTPQTVTASAKITSHVPTGDFPHTLLDLTSIHGGLVKSHLRGAGLTADRKVAVLRDELQGLPANTPITWSMLTRASATTHDNTLTLTQSGKTLQMVVLSSDDHAKIEILDLSKPANEWDSPNPGVKKIAVTFSPSPAGDASITVMMKSNTIEQPAFAPARLADWPAK